MQHPWPGTAPDAVTTPPTAEEGGVLAEGRAPAGTSTMAEAAETAEAAQAAQAAQDAEAAAVAGDLRSLDEIERQLDDVDVALRRLDDGTYGTCETCGRTIDETVLEVSPATRLCTGCAPATARTLFAQG